MLLILPHNKEKTEAWPSFFSPLLSSFYSVSLLSTFLIISLLLLLSPSLCFIRLKQRSHITGTPEGHEKEHGREEKF